MGRHSSPRYYPSRSAWYTVIQGKQIRLASGLKETTRKAAMAEFQRLLTEITLNDGALPSEVKVAVLCDLLLQEVQQTRTPLTFDFYRRHLQSFCDRFGTLNASEIRPLHVTRWISSHQWAPSTQHGAIGAVKRAFHWGKKQGLLKTNYLESVEKPARGRREKIPTGDQIAAILQTAQNGFRTFLEILHETGMRPSECMRLAREHIDFDKKIVTMTSKTTHRTKRLREIFLTDRAVSILQPLCETHPDGPLLRNARNNGWSRHALAQSCARLRLKLGMGAELTCESFRHSWITDALERGVPIATVSALAGHVDTQMVSRVYSKLHDRKDHLHEALKKVRPDTNPDDREPGT